MKKEDKMLSTYFEYPVPKCEDLEDIIRLSNNIKVGKDLLRSKYPNIDIEIKLAGDELYNVYYNTVIKGEKEEDFRNALSDFFKTCGTPHYVCGNCNYLVDEILQQYGKRVKGGVLSRLLFKRKVTENKENDKEIIKIDTPLSTAAFIIGTAISGGSPEVGKAFAKFIKRKKLNEEAIK